MKIDLVIMTYKPDERFLEQIEQMTSQTVTLGRVIIMNVEEKYFDRLMFTTKFMDEHRNFEVHHLSEREFDCGKSRNMALKYTDADYVLFMKQDMLPVGNDVIEKLYSAFEFDAKVAVSYARQVPRDEAGAGEAFIYRYFFPEEGSVRTLKDLETTGWKACMNSNGCALYKCSVLAQLGGFLNHVITGEDILYAGKALQEGYKVAYVPGATVVNVRKTDPSELEKEFFDKAVSFAKHPELFKVSEVWSEFKKTCRQAVAYSNRNGRYTDRIAFRQNAGRALRGFRRGKGFKRLSWANIRRSSANREYWRADELLRDRSSVNSRLGYGRSSEEMDMMKNNPVKPHKWEKEEKE